MFDIGFSEIVVCLVVALVVIGPERMPETVRTIGLWIGRLKRSLRETREEIERQIGVDDIRRQLHNEDIMRSLENARADIDQALQDSQQALDHEAIARNQSYTYEHDELPNHAHEPTQETLIEQPHSAEQEIREPAPHNALIENDTAQQPTKTPL